jgi:mannose-6-phosphate isomerase-like protein (cupin superfamily)
VPEWRFVHLDQLERPEPPADENFTEEEREAAREELRQRPSGQAERNERVRSEFPQFGKRWRAVRRVLGITGFGVAANVADSGEPLIIPHDESEHGHEELYVVVRGKARFDVGGKTHDGGPGAMLYAPPGVMRSVMALEPDTLLLMVGGKPGAFTPPIWSPDWRPPETWLEQHRRR